MDNELLLHWLQRAAAEQSAGMRNPALRRNTAPGQGSMAHAGPPVQGYEGTPSGPGNPWDQVPGGGSAANALPPANPMVDDRRYYTDLAEDAFANMLLGYGVAGGSMMAPPTPLSLAGAAGGALYGFGNGLAHNYATRRGRDMGYQGN